MENFFLPPDWRHAHCSDLISRRPTRPRVRINRLIRSYLSYLRYRRDHAPGVDSSSRPLRNLPFQAELRLVHLIQHSPDCQQVRLELQTRILADQPPQAIAQATGLSQQEVSIFEFLYYCVRERLNVQPYIFGVVINECKATDQEELFQAAMLKLAYCGGAAGLDTVLLLGRMRAFKYSGLIAEYINQLRDVLGRVDRSELQSFLARDSRQGLQALRGGSSHPKSCLRHCRCCHKNKVVSESLCCCAVWF
jgi:hypothetical protein